MKIYLAGPEVFLKNAIEIGARKVAIAAKFGFEGLYPLDAALQDEAADGAGDGAFAEARTAAAIFAANVALIDAADACLANLSPYKGADCDPGTAWEVGYAYAKGKIIAGYTNDPTAMAAREEVLDVAGVERASERIFPLARTTPELFDLPTNLMLAETLTVAGATLTAAPEPRAFDDLDAFERCLEALNERIAAAEAG